MPQLNERDSKMTTMPSYSIKVKSTSGTMFVVVAESVDRNPVHVQIFVGKTGSNLSAYNYSLSALITHLLITGVSLEKIIELLSNTTSDRISYQGQHVIRSDIDAIVYGLMKYKEEKFKESRPILRIRK